MEITVYGSTICLLVRLERCFGNDKNQASVIVNTLLKQSCLIDMNVLIFYKIASIG